MKSNSNLHEYGLRSKVCMNGRYGVTLVNLVSVAIQKQKPCV